MYSFTQMKEKKNIEFNDTGWLTASIADFCWTIIQTNTEKKHSFSEIDEKKKNNKIKWFLYKNSIQLLCKREHLFRIWNFQINVIQSRMHTPIVPIQNIYIFFLIGSWLFFSLPFFAYRRLFFLIVSQNWPLIKCIQFPQIEQQKSMFNIFKLKWKIHSMLFAFEYPSNCHRLHRKWKCPKEETKQQNKKWIDDSLLVKTV